MRATTTGLLFIGLLGLPSLAPQAALARAGDAAPSPEERAKAHYLKGATLYSQNDYGAAWLEFTSAYQILPRPELLFNMARCEVKMGRPGDALRHYREYLAAVPGDRDAEVIRREMSALETAAQRQARREAESPREAPQQPEVARRPFPVYGTISAAGTALLGVTAVALLGSVSSQYGYLEGFCSPLCRMEEVDPLRRQAVTGYVFLGLTAAGAVTTAALLTWELRRRPAETSPLVKSPLVTRGPGGLGLAWRF